MSKHYSLRRQRFGIEFRPACRASAHGGQLAPFAILEEFGLHRRLQQQPALDPRTDKNHGFGPEVYVVSFLVAFTSGGGAGREQPVAGAAGGQPALVEGAARPAAADQLPVGGQRVECGGVLDGQRGGV